MPLPPTLPSRHHHPSIVRQVIAALILDHPFTPSHLPSPHFPGWTSDSVHRVLASIPSFLFLSPRSVGRQPPSSRHRSPLKQRHLRLESHHLRLGLPLHGPPAHRDPSRIRLFLSKSLQFYSWLHSPCGFSHTESTCRQMCLILVRSNCLGLLWNFLKSSGENLVTTATVTAVIKALGEDGLAAEALAAFYRMKQLHCKPDVQCYNTVIAALCRVANFKKARFLLAQMELPGARCPPDAYTYTVFISSYCKHSLQTGCRKAIRRRMWEANHMFRHMLFMGFDPDVVTYNCLIDGLTKTYRIGRAHELFDDMIVRGCLPNRVTYNSFIRYYSAVNEVDRGIEMMRLMVTRNHGVPTSSSYTPIIHSLCEAGRVREAKEFLVEMVDGGNVPREYTFKLVCDALRNSGEEALPHDMCRRIEDGMDERYRKVMQVKPMMSGRRLIEGQT